MSVPKKMATFFARGKHIIGRYGFKKIKFWFEGTPRILYPC